MAGQLKVDSINADSNLSFRIANTAVAFIDSNGLRPTSGNVSLDSTGTTGVRSPAANTLVLYTAGTEDVRVTSAGLVGIGTSTPTVQLLNIGATSVSGPTNNPVGIQLTDNGVSLSNQIVNRAGNILYNVPSTKSHSFQIDSTEAVAMYANGIGLGGAVPSSGVGITFPATQSASSDANTLDDYEEGTFTLTITPNSGSLTSYDRYGYYIKTGRQVMITCAFSIINAGTASGVANFSGLPFTSLTVPTLTYGANRAGTSAWREDGATGNWFFGRIDSNATSGVITTSTNGAITWTAGYAYVASFVYQSAV